MKRLRAVTLQTTLMLRPGGSYHAAFGFTTVATTACRRKGQMDRKSEKHPVFQWSGAIYSSGGCDSDGECATALCNGCTPYQGLIGPVTLAEMTLAVNTSAKTALAKERHGMSFHTTTSVAY
jgi:hypothetical protein